MIRVTEVLNFFKEQWYIDWVHRVGRTEANRIGKAAMKIGSRVDELIKESTTSHLICGSQKDKPEVLACLEAYRKWLAVYKPKEIVPGTRLYATIEGQEVTGEPDIFVDGVLVDIKCASKISPSYWVQVNMYRWLDSKNKFKDAPFPLDEYKASLGRVGILRLDKLTGSYEYVVKDYDPFLCDVWCGLMRAMVYFKGDENGGTEL